MLCRCFRSALSSLRDQPGKRPSCFGRRLTAARLRPVAHRSTWVARSGCFQAKNCLYLGPGRLSSPQSEIFGGPRYLVDGHPYGHSDSLCCLVAIVLFQLLVHPPSTARVDAYRVRPRGRVARLRQEPFRSAPWLQKTVLRNWPRGL